MMFPFLIYLVTFLIITTVTLSLIWRWIFTISSNLSKLPPAKRGWLPWIGVAYEFGKAPLNYIKQANQQLGDIFTIYAAGRNMTFLFDSKDSEVFFKSALASFQGAAQAFTVSAANISPDSFYKVHSKIHDIFKGRLSSHHLNSICPQLSLSFYKQITKQCGAAANEMDLMQFVRNIMFPAVFQQLFGNSNLQLTEDDIKIIQETFIKYDADFEYAQLPAFLNKEWYSSKMWLLEIFKKFVMNFLQLNKPPEKLIEHIIDAVDSNNAAGYSLMVLWASQANAIPITFWTLAFILSNPKVYSKIKMELDQWNLFDENGSFIEISEAHLKSITPTVVCAIMESIRLRSPGIIVRKVTNPIKIKEYVVPAGHFLMLSPYYCHRNPAYFPDPESFNPERWIDIDKGQFIPGFIAFGGGRYQCPGRWFALMELHLLISMILKMIDFTLLDPVPPPSSLHLVGSQQPKHTCRVRINKINIS